MAVGDETPAGGPGGPGTAERLLEVIVYAPVGAVLSAVDELPQWRERGRRAVSGQVATARVVGELAVRFGRRRLDAAVGSWTGSSGPSNGPPEPGGEPVGHRPSDRDAPPAPAPARDAPPAPAPARPRGETADRVPASTSAEAPTHVPSVGSLAIPGFDALSASQVVPRLEGLARDDLVAVRAYEGAHRRRRTVLGRVDQLLAERA